MHQFFINFIIWIIGIMTSLVKRLFEALLNLFEADGTKAQSSTLVQVNKFDNLLKAIVAISNVNSKSRVSLNDELDKFKMKWILIQLDSSLNNMLIGKKSKQEHQIYVLEKIKYVQRLSLQYHPDKFAHLNTNGPTEMQRKINSIVEALNNVHDYVMNSEKQSVSYIYRLFGELPIDLLLGNKDYDKIINLAVCSKVQDLAYWREGKLMEARNSFIIVTGMSLELLQIKLREYINMKEVNYIFFKDEMVTIKAVFQQWLRECKRYKTSYKNIWVENLKCLKADCNYFKDLEIIRLDVNQLLKEAEEQFILLHNECRFVVSDETFVKPLLDFTFYFDIYYNIFIKVSKKMSLSNIFRVINTTYFTSKMERYIELCLYEELFNLIQLLKKFILDKKYRSQHYDDILKFIDSHVEKTLNQDSSPHNHEDKNPQATVAYDELLQQNYCCITKDEIYTVIFLALMQLSKFLLNKFVVKETFFEKEKRRAEKSVKDMNEMKQLIVDMERQNQKLEELIREETNKKANAEKITEVTKILGKEFTLKVHMLDISLFQVFVQSQPQIIQTVAEWTVQHSSSPCQLLDKVIEEIKSEYDKGNEINIDELIQSGIHQYCNPNLSLNINDKEKTQISDFSNFYSSTENTSNLDFNPNFDDKDNDGSIASNDVKMQIDLKTSDENGAFCFQEDDEKKKLHLPIVLDIKQLLDSNLSSASNPSLSLNFSNNFGNFFYLPPKSLIYNVRGYNPHFQKNYSKKERYQKAQVNFQTSGAVQVSPMKGLDMSTTFANAEQKFIYLKYSNQFPLNKAEKYQKFTSDADMKIEKPQSDHEADNDETIYTF